MTIVYYVRHAEPNYENHDDEMRELTEKGLRDCKKVTEFLRDKEITVAVSSPFKRAVDTIRDFAESIGVEIEIIEDFRERKINSVWIENFNEFTRKQWSDFSFKLPDGECLKEVQERNIKALQKLIEKHKGKNIVLGGHGTALCTILNFYDSSFAYPDFAEMKAKMPYIVEFVFDEALRCRETIRHEV